MRSPLGNALGLGSAGEGASNWWTERLTAVALVPLTFWLVFSLLSLAAMTREEAMLWMQSPVNAVLLVLFLLTMFYHSFLGLQVIIEDYMHRKWLKVTTLISVQFAHVFLAVISIFSVLRMALAGDA